MLSKSLAYHTSGHQIQSTSKPSTSHQVPVQFVQRVSRYAATATCQTRNPGVRVSRQLQRGRCLGNCNVEGMKDSVDSDELKWPLGSRSRSATATWIPGWINIIAKTPTIESSRTTQITRTQQHATCSKAAQTSSPALTF